MRSFDRCLPNLQWYVFRHFPGAKFYIATEDDEDAHKADLLSGAIVRKVKQPEMILPHGCPPTWTAGQPYMHESYFISVPPSHVMGQLWMLREGWRVYEDANEPADLIIRCRPDLWFHSFKFPQDWPAWRNNRSRVPCWGKFGGINDRFALLRPDAAKSYYSTYDRLGDFIAKGAPMHPESLVHHSLQFDGCSIDDSMHAIFSTLRKSGEFRPPEITAVDMLGR